VLLPDDLIERLRAVFAGENRVAHAGTLDASGRIEKRHARIFHTRRLAIGNARCFPAGMLGNLIGPEIKELIIKLGMSAA